MAVMVELDGAADRRVLLRQLEQAALHGSAVAVTLARGLDDGAGVYALMHMQRHRGHLEGGVLGLPRPLQLRVEVRVVGVGLPSRVPVGLRRDEADGRVVESIFVPVIVGLDGPLGLVVGFSFWHGMLRMVIVPAPCMCWNVDLPLRVGLGRWGLMIADVADPDQGYRAERTRAASLAVHIFTRVLDLAAGRDAAMTE